MTHLDDRRWSARRVRRRRVSRSSPRSAPQRRRVISTNLLWDSGLLFARWRVRLL